MKYITLPPPVAAALRHAPRTQLRRCGILSASSATIKEELTHRGATHSRPNLVDPRMRFPRFGTKSHSQREVTLTVFGNGERLTLPVEVTTKVYEVALPSPTGFKRPKASEPS